MKAELHIDFSVASSSLSGLHLKRLKFFQNSISYNVYGRIGYTLSAGKILYTVMLEVSEADRDTFLRFFWCPHFT